VQVVWGVGLPLKDIIDGLVKDGDGTWVLRVNNLAVCQVKAFTPVTPAIVRGCAPNTENMNAAMNVDKRTSATPYCCVVSMRSREKAIPGSTL